MGRAIKMGLLGVAVHSLRQYSGNRRGMIDDAPYGGGEGMVFRPEPLAKALKPFRAGGQKRRPIIFLTPQGQTFTHQKARQLGQSAGAILLCGRYAGIDERIRQLFVDEELSLGDYVLMGGELPAMAVLEAAARFIPGVLGHADSAQHDSFEDGLLEGPLYTRPREFGGLGVPSILLSGNHRDIQRWRRQKALERTRSRRPGWAQKAQQGADFFPDSDPKKDSSGV